MDNKLIGRIVMDIITRMLAAVGVVALAVLVINTASAGAGEIKAASERHQASQVAMIELHKLDYPASDDDNYVTDPMNGFDDEVVDTYEESVQAQTARHANSVIARAYGRE